jgi:hypothetical protein
MQLKQLRIPIGIICGLLIVIFGVFMFSNFIYRGLTLEANIFPLFESLNTISDGIYALLGTAYTVNIIDEFSAAALAQSSLTTIFFGSSVWPEFLAWCTAGLLVSIFAKGFKRGIYSALVLYGFVFLFYIVFAFFAGADIGAQFVSNIGLTLGKLFSAFVFLLPGALIGGIVSGPYEEA